MDGLEALKRLRADPLTRLLPVIILTGQTDHGSKVTGYVSGAERYVEKPVHYESLIAEVKHMLESGETAADRRAPAPRDPRG